MTLNEHRRSERQRKRRSLQRTPRPAEDEAEASTTEEQKSSSKSAADIKDADPEGRAHGGAEKILPYRKEEDHNQPAAVARDEDREAAMEKEETRTGPQTGSRAVVVLSTASFAGATAQVERPPSSIGDRATTEANPPRLTPENRRRRGTKDPRRAYHRGTT